MSSNARLQPGLEPGPQARRQRPGSRRFTRILAIGVGTLAAVVVAASLLPNEPVRRSIERRMNKNLRGYEVRIGKACLQPLGLALTFENLVIRQSAHPEPAVLEVPRLRARLQFRELMFFRLVADVLVDRPRGYVNLEQLRTEAADSVPVREKGWQQAVEAIYPLKINHFRLRDGELTYIDDDPRRPLKLTHLELRASNIRNIHLKERTYPSPIQASAVVFGSGKAQLEGDANFLSEPYAGVRGRFRLEGIPLDDLSPVAAHWNAIVSGGSLSTAGEVEFAPKVRGLRLLEVTLDRVKIGYVRKAAAAKGVAPAEPSAKPADLARPAWKLALDRFQLRDSELELVDRQKTPSYRVFVSHVNADVVGLASEPEDQKAKATVLGKFMGMGDLKATAAFAPGRRNADFDVKLEIAPTPLRSLNDVFRAWGKFDVARGEFLLFTEVRVHNAFVHGYVKPIFRDVEIYDARQDAGKPLLKKVYEGIVDAAAKVLKNHKNDQVATEASIEGPLGGANANLWDVLAGLLENAFVRAILPGFDRQVGPLRPPR